MANNNGEQGVVERIKARLLQATGEDELRQIRQELKDQGEKPGSVDACVSELRKKGYLKFSKGTEGFYPVKVGKDDLIPPEVALRNFQLQDGDYRKGFTDGMAVLILAARYNQVLAASQAEILANQLQIMEESRKGSAEVAQEAASRAAAGVAAEVLPKIDALQAQIVAQSGHPFAGLMVSMMAPAFQQAGQQLMRLFTGTQPGGQPGQSQPGQPGSWQPPNVTTYRRDADGGFSKSVDGVNWQKVDDEAEVDRLRQEYGE